MAVILFETCVLVCTICFVTYIISTLWKRHVTVDTSYSFSSSDEVEDEDEDKDEDEDEDEDEVKVEDEHIKDTHPLVLDSTTHED